MPKLKAEEFLDLVKRSGLVDNQRLSEVLSGIDMSSISDSGIVASNLTKAGLLTEWQTENLLNGRHKGFYLGKYKFLNHLGKGGMGNVYLAEHVVMRHRVAIKVLPKHLASQSSYLERFHQEARACALLNHPNIVRAFDVDHEGENHYLVMEFVDGTDLQSVVAPDRPLPVQLAAEYTRQAAEGLAFAHQAGLVHRDIKPANLLLDKTGTVKILDFGLARFSNEGAKASLTMAYDEKMIGTVDYLAPEQALDSHAVDSRADIYSLGCTLYFMLTGRPPFPDGTITQRLVHHQKSDPDSIRMLRPEVPADLVAICSRMMAKLPADRYQTAGDVYNALTEWLDRVGPVHSVSRPEATTSTVAMSIGGDELALAPLEDEPSKQAAAPKSVGAAKPGDSSKLTPAGKSGKGSGILAPVKGSDSTKKSSSGSMPTVAKAAAAARSQTPSKTDSKGVESLLDEELSDDLLGKEMSLPLPDALANAEGMLSSPMTQRGYTAPERVYPLWALMGIGASLAVIILIVIFLIHWLHG